LLYCLGKDFCCWRVPAARLTDKTKTGQP